MPNSKKTPLSRLRIVRGLDGRALYVGSRHIEALPDGSNLTERHINLIECLLQHVGTVVTYERLSRVMNWSGTTADEFRHCLRQYIHQLNTVFRKSGLDVHFAVAGGVGYALCEPAKR
jgi:DNA-binding winged helix-turn-helix (wHTH) protein